MSTETTIGFLLFSVFCLGISLLSSWVNQGILRRRIERLENTLNDHGIYPQKENE